MTISVISRYAWGAPIMLLPSGSRVRFKARWTLAGGLFFIVYKGVMPYFAAAITKRRHLTPVWNTRHGGARLDKTVPAVQSHRLQ
jgi:hypothetical protein